MSTKSSISHAPRDFDPPIKVAFRVDASLKIGSGHLMRCLTLADCLSESGARCLFICREHPGHLTALIKQRGHSLSLLPTRSESPVTDQAPPMGDLPKHASWLGCHWETDARETIDHVNRFSPDWLVIDHYAIDYRWESMFARISKRFVIDDLVDRAHDCDMLLDQNLGRESQDYTDRVPQKCTVLAGPRYALLRPEFAKYREASLSRRRIPSLRHILVTMGGVDADNATGKVLDVLARTPLEETCRITVVMGASAPWLQEVKAKADSMPYRVEVLSGVSNMAMLMTDADLAIGAAGSTSWERCCLGLPSILVCLADNQRDTLQCLVSRGAAIGLEMANLMVEMQAAILKLIESKHLLTFYADNALKITDGFGASRVREFFHA